MERRTRPVTKEEVMAIELWERCRLLADTYAVLATRATNPDDKDRYTVWSQTLLEVLERVNDDGK